MIKSNRYNFWTSFSPLDLVTIFYVFTSGIYICFSSADFAALVPHFLTRLLILSVILTLSQLNALFPSNKLILFLKNLYPFLFLGFFYTETSCMKNIIFKTDLDGYIFNAEQSLWNCQPSIEFSKVMDQAWFGELMNMFYFSYYIIIGLTGILLYLNNPEHSAKGIFIIIFSFYLYYFVFDVFPVVGPKYYVPGLNAEPESTLLFGRVMRWVISDFEKPTGAFPSSHAGIAVVIAYVTHRYYRKLFWITLPFVVGICFATVYTQAHYLVDVIAGIITSGLFISLSIKIYNKFLSYRSYKNIEKIDFPRNGEIKSL